MDSPKTIAIGQTKDMKIASLFFDRVLPLVGPKSNPHIPDEILFDGWQNYIAKPFELQDHLHHAEIKLAKLKKSQAKGWSVFDDPKVRSYSSDLMYFYLNENIIGIKDRLAKQNLSSMPIFTDDAYYSFFNSAYPEKSIEVVLSSAPLIDPKKLEWEQIVDIRHDKRFREKARNFRLFLFENYADKSQQYIVESLEKKLDEYESACKKHGVNLVLSTLKTTLDSQSLLATLGVTATAILLGQPIVASGALATGVTIEIGKLVIGIVENRMSMREFKGQSDISYLFDIRQKMDK